MSEEGARTVRLTSGTSTESIDPSYRPKVLKRSGLSIESNEFDIYNQAKILVLYCGGTIGMKSHGGGKMIFKSSCNICLPVNCPVLIQGPFESICLFSFMVHVLM